MPDGVERKPTLEELKATQGEFRKKKDQEAQVSAEDLTRRNEKAKRDSEQREQVLGSLKEKYSRLDELKLQGAREDVREIGQIQVEKDDAMNSLGTKQEQLGEVQITITEIQSWGELDPDVASQLATMEADAGKIEVEVGELNTRLEALTGEELTAQLTQEYRGLKAEIDELTNQLQEIESDPAVRERML